MFQTVLNPYDVFREDISFESLNAALFSTDPYDYLKLISNIK